jgi:hypothetical protein
MPKDIVLVNVSKQLFTFNLPHQIYCAEAGECRCRFTDLNLRQQTKEGVLRKVKRVRTPDAITIPSRETSPGLHPAVLKVPEVKHALRHGPRRLMIKGG